MPAEPVAAARPRLWFVVESGTDVRLVDGMAAFAEVTVLARRVPGGVEISRPARAGVVVRVGPPALGAFAAHVFRAIRAEREQIDFVLVQGYGAAALGVNLALRLCSIPGAMLVCSPAEAYYQCRQAAGMAGKPYRRSELAAIRILAKMNARAGRRYIVLSSYLGEIVRRHGGTSAVAVIPVYGVDTDVFRCTDRSGPALRCLRGLPGTGSIIFNSSRIAPEKDSDTLLGAFARLRAEGRDVYLLHRSGGFRRFLADAAAAGVADRVIATDAVHPLEELPLDYAAADVCVQASRAEGLGYSVLEAMACGTPVVASHVGGLIETVVDKQTGWSYPSGDAEALARCLADALDHPEEARRRADAGRAMVEQRYERSRAFAALAALVYDAAAARRGGR